MASASIPLDLPLKHQRSTTEALMNEAQLTLGPVPDRQIHSVSRPLNQVLKPFSFFKLHGEDALLNLVVREDAKVASKTQDFA